MGECKLSLQKCSAERQKCLYIPNTLLSKIKKIYE